MTAPPVSVIVVSRGRPHALQQCLAGILQLDHPNFELVLVADQAGLAAAEAVVDLSRVKSTRFDDRNISIARNHGLALAAGEVVAFIDDDAIPDSAWLTNLAMPFEDSAVAASGGFVRGPDGKTFQFTGRRVDRLGQHSALDLEGSEAKVFATSPGQAIKTEGTNCAFRTSVLRRMGGFDPAFRYYLDDTDINLRLAAKSLLTAVVPRAQVRHGLAASIYRHASRVPKSLFEIGASQAVFLRKHAPDNIAEGLEVLRDEQRKRLLGFMVNGRCEPRDVEPLLTDLDAGITDGMTRVPGAGDAI